MAPKGHQTCTGRTRIKRKPFSVRHTGFLGGGDERKHFSLGGGFNNRNLFGYRGDGNSLGRIAAADDGVGVSMETFLTVCLGNCC